MNTTTQVKSSDKLITLLLGTACIFAGLFITLFSISADARTPIILIAWVIWAAVCGFVYHVEKNAGVQRKWMLARDTIVLLAGLYLLNLAMQ